MPSRPESLFFHGFSLCNERELFEDKIDTSPFSVCGFSYGAIKAYRYAIESGKRVDKLQLFSPAFFQDKDTKYKRMQLMFYQKDREGYTKTFLQNCAFPSQTDLEPYLCEGTIEELRELLNYDWDQNALQNLIKNGTTLEIHLGRKDRIIDAQKALEFFRPFATVYFYNDYGHILKGNNT